MIVLVRGRDERRGADAREAPNEGGEMADLEGVGLRPGEEAIYRTLIELPPSTPDELREHLRQRHPDLAEQVDEAATALERKGLIDKVPGDDRRYAPVSPDVALDPLILGRERELNRARTAFSELTERFRRITGDREADEIIEVITDPEVLRGRVIELQHRARSRIRGFDRPPYAVPDTVADTVIDAAVNPVERAGLARGVGYRYVYDRTCLRRPGYLAHLETMATLGEQCRIAPEVPMKLLLCDDDLGILPLQRESLRSCVIVRTSSLLEALSALFETVWNHALPLRFDEPDEPMSGPPSADERRLLSMLVTGADDHDIAGQLGVSRRTVHRRIHDLMVRLDAASRFQLGVEACRRGWL
jgi:sugar-specific transcriptional regulator TrmB